MPNIDRVFDMNIEEILNMKHNDFMKYVLKNVKGIDVKDGIYDVDGIDYIKVDKGKPTVDWIISHDKFWVASAYATECIFLFAEEPRKFEGDWDGSGFNYGSTNIITNCPRTVLILAEDD